MPSTMVINSSISCFVSAFFPLPYFLEMIFYMHIGEDDVGERRKMATFILKENKFVVMGHRGSGMNILQSCDRRSKAIKENTLCSFNEAAKFNVDFIEFDVQVR